MRRIVDMIEAERDGAGGVASWRRDFLGVTLIDTSSRIDLTRAVECQAAAT